ncbi:hypothetical protein [Escherichia coli]|uniref:hypothetical protein n=1 Tax=Escherichia coli TaxID=562 RepID=UPI001980CAC7
MAHNTKHHNSDADPASRHGRRSHAFKYDWYQHDQCTEEQAEWLIQNYRRRGYQFQKGLSPDFRRWIIVSVKPMPSVTPAPCRLN